MIPRNCLAVVLTLFGLGAGLVPSRGQVILNPNDLGGTIHFTNTNPTILSLLKPPGNKGMSNVFVSASSLPPAPRFPRAPVATFR